MKVTIERFNTGGGWYLKVDDRTVAALLPSDIEYITKRCHATGGFVSHGGVAKLVRKNKEKYPQYYCSNPDCLYRTETALGHRDCPKHGGGTDGQEHNRKA